MRRLLSQIATFGAFILGGFGAAVAGAPQWAVITVAVAIYLPLSLLVDRWAPARMPTPAEIERRAWLKAIGLMAISLVFCGGAVLLLHSNGRLNGRVSLATLAMFGASAIVSVDLLLRRLRERRLRSLGIHRVGIIGGVDIPIARGRYLAGALGSTALGMTLYAAGAEHPAPLRVGALVFAAFGLGLFAALPFIGRQRIRCDPQSLRIGTLRFDTQIPWDSIRGVGLLEHASNPFVTLQLSDPGLVRVQPSSRRAAFLKRVGFTRGWYGADIVIAPHVFGLQATLLAAAIRRYASEPAARGELTARGELAERRLQSETKQA